MAVLVHYGERNEALVEALLSRGAALHELVYQWELPEDTAPLLRIVEELSQEAFAAAAFTSQIQARNLLLVAESAGRRKELLDALRFGVMVAAVGPTCARVLAELGIAALGGPRDAQDGGDAHRSRCAARRRKGERVTLGSVSLVGAGREIRSSSRCGRWPGCARPTSCSTTHSSTVRRCATLRRHAGRSSGKRAGRPSISQRTIEKVMIRRALRGERVVRLKSGDPFVFGRGGEEALALAAAGVPCEIVPGVSSALARPALCGIPVTHRGLALAFLVVSGHAPSGFTAALESLAPGAATVVVLMGLATRADTGLLLSRGWDPETPACGAAVPPRRRRRVPRVAPRRPRRVRVAGSASGVARAHRRGRRCRRSARGGRRRRGCGQPFLRNRTILVGAPRLARRPA